MMAISGFREHKLERFNLHFCDRNIFFSVNQILFKLTPHNFVSLFWFRDTFSIFQYGVLFFVLFVCFANTVYDLALVIVKWFIGSLVFFILFHL